STPSTQNEKQAESSPNTQTHQKAAANTQTHPAAKPAAKPAVQASETDSLTPDEKKRLKKLLETQKALQAAPDWNDFLKAQEEELHRLRDEILPGMTEATRSTLRAGASNPSSASGQHIADAGSDAEVRDITLRLLDKDRETVYEIDAALERIRLGTYGICEMSLEPIPRGRLQVRPYCRLTVACQQEYEKKHGTAARFRPQNSRLIGYAGSQNEIDPAVSLDDDEE
ncbi:MAG: TraR/DksA family transcriptional regulator, partial [Akkermansia sp.]|nr:TraR/DksA family transcriptional regulator [Akkermansia sp.]